MPWFKQLQICVDNGPCYYFSNMSAAEHTYLEGTKFTKIWPDSDGELDEVDIDEFNETALD